MRPALVFIVFYMVILAGCAPRQHSFRGPAGYRQMQKVEFRGCQRVDEREGKDVCDCTVKDWIIDAKTKQWIAVCAEKHPRATNEGNEPNAPTYGKTFDQDAQDGRGRAAVAVEDDD